MHEPIKVDIMQMLRKHHTQIANIERDVWGVFAWDEDDVKSETSPKNRMGIVAEYRGCVVGYAVFQLYPNILRIVNITVRPDFQRQHVGVQMVSLLKQKVKQHPERHSVQVILRERNLDAQLFFKELGFVCVAQLPTAFRDDEADPVGYLLRYSDDPRRVQPMKARKQTPEQWLPRNRISDYDDGKKTGERRRKS